MSTQRLFPTPTVNGNNNRRGISKKAGDGLATAVKLFTTLTAADRQGTSGGRKTGRSLRNDTRSDSPQFISSPVASLASRTRLQDAIKGLLTNVISGPSTGVSLAYLGPDGQWLKMYRAYFQATLDGSLEKFSLTWPRWGMLSGGVLTELSMWERGTEETASLLWATPMTRDASSPKSEAALLKEATLIRPGRKVPNNLVDQVSSLHLWPTPTVQDSKNDGAPSQEERNSVPLNTLVKMFPTPTAHDGRRPGRDIHSKQVSNLKKQIEEKNPGQLNADWVEWLMGLNIGFTSLPGYRALQRAKKTALTASKRFGNAVVPQQVYLIYKAIVEIEEGLHAEQN